MTAPPEVRQNGYAIRTIRQIQGMSLEELAERCGLAHRVSLRNVENENKSASEELLNRIARALGIDTAAIQRNPPPRRTRSAVVDVVSEPERQAS